MQATYDAVIVGGGHNGLTAAAYLSRAGRSVLLLERADHVGGATVSARAFDGVDARVSRYSYLVSLLPRQVRDELGLRVDLRRRRISSCTPAPGGRALVVDTGDDAATAASFADVGAGADVAAWRAFGARTGLLAARLFPTMTEPLMSTADARRLLGHDDWRDLVERPVGEVVEATFASDLVRGIVLTDALIGTFASVHEPGGRANRCFLYHVVGGGTGDWDVPVGGMGALAGALEAAARAGGTRIVTSADVTTIVPGSATTAAEVGWTDAEGGQHAVGARHVLAACAPAVLDRLLGRAPGQAPEGAQLKLNMLLTRLPRLRSGVDPRTAFAGTLHVHESATELEAAYRQAAVGRVPDVPPVETYCHSLTDDSILGPDLRASGHHTLTAFGLHMPARLFAADPDGARERALGATLRSLDSVLAEPLEDCLARDATGAPCLEVRSPVDLEADVGLPGGHIFHRDLAWPWAEHDDEVGTWGVETADPRVLVAGAGARRGGGVSGIPGRAAALAVLSAT
ncbi:phytoene desaturase family protein [Cellulomonas fengjieae]|uniref:phytoene desaturase family protein n=1 Tax=Cellulomonas fengjieae TaxID=2819978 RepID=UPI001AAE4429|nr:NAD(P)/FAD-dependent oxidoreductase [Cellulomonas fengjieae]MBO3103327.1 NAD(P)/FAD-dependent oxidoreductase [Cellulomonas fengjieae]